MKIVYGLSAACALGLLAVTLPMPASWNGRASAASEAATASEGRLVARQGDRILDVPLEHTDVRIRVDGHLADATVKQIFHNPYRDKIEAVYLFPLPANAAVHHMEMKIGERVIKGAMARRNTAERIYKRARRKGLVAALLTQERPNLFTQSVANIEPGARIEITLRYVHALRYEAGAYELVFPMVAGPRHLPGGQKDRSIQPQVVPPGMRSGHDIALQVDIAAGVAIRGVESPSHRLDIASGQSPGPRAKVAIARGDTIPNKDFVLRYKVAGPAPEMAVLAHRGAGDKGSFFLMAQPPALDDHDDDHDDDAESAGQAIAHREIIFALDTSSSMSGAPLAKAKEVIRRVLRGLRPDDTYQIVRFSDSASALGPRPIANKAKNIEYTLQWLDALSASGATEMQRGIAAALAVPHDPARLRIVVFLTDGFVGNEDQILATVAETIGDSRLFSFGVGSAVNRYLLEEMAALGRGAVQVVRPDEDTQAAVARLYHRIDKPVLTDIHIDWNGLAVSDLAPARIPDLFAGQPVIVSGRYREPGSATISVHGKSAGRDVQFQVPVVFAASGGDGPAVASVWARSRIKELSRQLVRERDTAAENEIIALALEHQLMTRYTAFVAVDQSRVTAGAAARKVAVPVEVPDAVRRVNTSRGAIGYGYGTLGVASYASGRGGSFGSGSGAMRVRTMTVPQVRIGKTHVTGRLDSAIIRRYVRRKLPKVRYCYQKALARQPDLEATAATRFIVNPDGAVIAADVTGTGDDELDACIAAVIKGIEFPAAKGGGSLQIHYPFHLKPPKPLQGDTPDQGELP